ncbi:hypothetical protein, partial [Escherichia coli]|uniref:hypothetical protein n=1 Tax=Escherichia coli TaxID=562 RepID=UPI001BC864BE
MGREEEGREESSRTWKRRGDGKGRRVRRGRSGQKERGRGEERVKKKGRKKKEEGRKGGIEVER